MNYSKKILVIVFMLLTQLVKATTFYVDPTNGNNTTGNGSITNPWKTLEYVIANNLIESNSYVLPYDENNPQTTPKNVGAPIKAGDTIILYSGLHGELFIQNYINSDYITVKAATGHIPIMKSCFIQTAKKWRFENISFSSEPYNTYINGMLVLLESSNFLGPVDEIEIKNCHIYSTLSQWITAEDWNNKASHGIFVSGNNILLENNIIENTSFGITLAGDYIQAKNNTINHFSGDGLRIVGSNNLVESNLIKNAYETSENHGDGIQSFTTGGVIADNNIVRKNTIIHYEDPNHPLLGDMQGIGCFDGPFNNWTVENNVIVAETYHGITFLGGVNVNILNNTVIDPNPTNVISPTWIMIDDDPVPPEFLTSNCVVKNNISSYIYIKPNSNTISGNNLILSGYTDYGNNFVDYQNRNYHLLQTSSAVDNADNQYAPATDIEGTTRPQGTTSDIGAYEFRFATSVEEGQFINDFKIYQNYPNPFNPTTTIKYSVPSSEFVLLKIYDVLGKEVMTLVNETKNAGIYQATFNASYLSSGMYIYKMTAGNFTQTNKMMLIK